MKLRLFRVPEVRGYIVVIMAIATLIIVAGAYWDFWWHVNNGRDNFWIPPHLVIYSGLVVTIICTSRAIADNRFDINNVLGIAFLSIIGFIVAAPFDDWWHRTYPIEEKGLHAITPPHALVVISATFLGLGISIMLNRFYSARRTSRLAGILSFSYSAGGLSVVMFAQIILDPYSSDYILGTLGSVSFGFFTPAYLIANEMYYKERGFVTKLAMVSSVLRYIVNSSIAYLVMTILPSILLDLLAKRLHNYSKVKYAVAGGTLFATIALLLYFIIQTFLSGEVALPDLIARYALGASFGAMSGFLAFGCNRVAMKILK